MPRFTNGWVRLDRSILNTDIWEDPKLFRLFSLLLLWANVLETTVKFKGKPMTIPPGTIVTGYRQLADATGLSFWAVRDRSRYLAERGNLVVKTDRKGLIITICNWDKYQLPPISNQSKTDLKPISDQQPTKQYNNKTTNVGEAALNFDAGELLTEEQQLALDVKKYRDPWGNIPAWLQKKIDRQKSRH
jgi:hypothetical protein